MGATSYRLCVICWTIRIMVCFNVRNNGTKKGERPTQVIRLAWRGQWAIPFGAYLALGLVVLMLAVQAPAGAGQTPTFATFIGGTLWEEGRRVALDPAGNIYLTGYTTSTDFPTGSLRANPTHGIDIYVVKLSPDGSTLLYSVFLNTATLNAEDYGNALTVDQNGYAYVVGETRSPDLCPAGLPGYDLTYDGDDAFLFRLDPAGNMDYCTFLGGTDFDQANAVAVDDSGIYLAGSTWSTDFPITSGGPHNGLRDAFLLKFDPAGTTLLYSTFIGGELQESVTDMALDDNGNAYATGWTSSPNFPAPTGYDTTYGGEFDAFALKLNPAGNTLLYSTFIGGNNEDRGYGLVVDSSGRATLTGRTLSATDFPLQAPFDNSHNGDYDAFVTTLDPAGTGLLFSSYFGGAGYESGTGLATSGQTLFLTGDTQSANLPLSANPFDDTLGGDSDAFLAVIDNQLLTYASYIGGSDTDLGQGLALNPNGQPIVTGRTRSTDFPVTAGGYDPTHNGDFDIFALHLTLATNYRLYLPLVQNN